MAKLDGYRIGIGLADGDRGVAQPGAFGGDLAEWGDRQPCRPAAKPSTPTRPGTRRRSGPMPGRKIAAFAAGSTRRIAGIPVSIRI